MNSFPNIYPVFIIMSIYILCAAVLCGDVSDLGKSSRGHNHLPLTFIAFLHLKVLMIIVTAWSTYRNGKSHFVNSASIQAVTVLKGGTKFTMSEQLRPKAAAQPLS